MINEQNDSLVMIIELLGFLSDFIIFCQGLWTHLFLISFFFMKHSSFTENMNRTCDNKNLGALTIIQTFKIGSLIHKNDNIHKSKAQEIRRFIWTSINIIDIIFSQN